MGVSLQPGLVPGSGLFPAVAPEGAPACLAACGCGCVGCRASGEVGALGALSAGCAGRAQGWPSVVCKVCLPLNWTHPLPHGFLPMDPYRKHHQGPTQRQRWRYRRTGEAGTEYIERSGRVRRAATDNDGVRETGGEAERVNQSQIRVPDGGSLPRTGPRSLPQDSALKFGDQCPGRAPGRFRGP